MRKLFKNAGYFVIIDWTDSARSFSVGGSQNKRIYYVNIKSPIRIKRIEQIKQMAFESETYNEIKINQLNKNGIHPIDLTAGMDIPRDSYNQTPEELALGTIEFHKRFG